MSDAPHVAAAIQAFRRLARPLGLKLGLFSATVLSSRADPPQVVLRLDDGVQVFILKWQERPQAVREMVAAADAQDAVRLALRGMPGLGVPRVVATGLTEKSVLLEPAPGQTLQSLLPEDSPTLMARVGHWLDAMHGKTEINPRAFQSKFMVAHVNRMAADVARRPTSLPDPAEFLRCATAVAGLSADADGQMARVAQNHGDFAACNIYLTDTETVVENFQPANAAPMAFDVARLVMDVMVMLHHRGVEVMRAAVEDGFFTTYRCLKSDDPVVQFLLKTRLLSEWRAIPANSAAHTPHQAERWQAIQKIASTLLPQ